MTLVSRAFTKVRQRSRNVRATLWIDKADLNWVRVDAEVIDDITWGWFVFRLAKGSHLSMEQVRVNDEV